MIKRLAPPSKQGWVMPADKPNITIPAEVHQVGVIYQKSQAFDLILKHRAELAEVNKKLQALQKSTAKNSGAMMGQWLGRKMQLEKTIDAIFKTVTEP